MLNGSTIEINDSALSGDPLTVLSPKTSVSVTLDLSDARVNLTEQPHRIDPTTVTANLSGKTDTLDATLNSAGNSALLSFSKLAVNLADNTDLLGSYRIDARSIANIIGGEQSWFINNTTDTLTGGFFNIFTDVRGTGTFDLKTGNGLPSFLQFGGFVSSGQTVDITGATGSISSVLIDQPKDFQGKVVLHDFSLARLAGIAQADSWSFKHDLLSIKAAGGKRIDTLQVVSDAPSTGSVHGLSVSTNASGTVFVRPGTDFGGSVVPTT
jgi:hypothetical protein